MNSLQKQMEECIRLARQGEKASAASRWNQCLFAVESMRTQNAALNAIPAMLWIKILKSQEKDDWVEFADILEYEILVQLSQSVNNSKSS